MSRATTFIDHDSFQTYLKHVPNQYKMPLNSM